jgi:DNA-binding response OmpR family regulator
MSDIVVLEDGNPLLRLMAWALVQEGFAVSEAERVAVALKVAEVESPSAIVTNSVGTPSERREAFQQLRTAAPGAMIIELYEGDPPDTGADVFVAPPYPIADIVEAIRQNGDHRNGRDQNGARHPA